MVYGTDFRAAELSLAELRGVRSSPVGWERPSSSIFLQIELLEAMLEKEKERWSHDASERVARAIHRFWSIAFDLPFEPTEISPLQGFDTMHDQRGLLASWPAPPDAVEFEQARAVYRAKLACTDRYIVNRMREFADVDSALAEALSGNAASGDCPVLAEVLEQKP